MSFFEMTMAQKNQLDAPLQQSHVVKPTSKFGPKGDYIEGWHAIAEANRIFGYNGWSYQIVELKPCHEPFLAGDPAKETWRVGYICTIDVCALGVTRQDVGYGSGAAKGIGDAHEGAVKEAVTDALKRTLRTFGNQFGLALYDKTQSNVRDGVEPVSAAEMKRGLVQIDEDLTDTHSHAALKALEASWGNVIKEQNWSKDYRDEARARFDRRLKQLDEEIEQTDLEENFT